jgi:hypothetical protein
MTVFELQKAITTDKSRIEVTGILKPGIYRFQLVVVDDQDNASEPMDRDVEIIAKPQFPRIRFPIQPAVQAPIQLPVQPTRKLP